MFQFKPTYEHLLFDKMQVFVPKKLIKFTQNNFKNFLECISILNKQYGPRRKKE